MKLSNETLVVLKNFATINEGIQFKKGTKLTTVSSSKTVLAQATLKDEFPVILPAALIRPVAVILPASILPPEMAPLAVLKLAAVTLPVTLNVPVVLVFPVKFTP